MGWCALDTSENKEIAWKRSRSETPDVTGPKCVVTSVKPCRNYAVNLGARTHGSRCVHHDRWNTIAEIERTTPRAFRISTAVETGDPDLEMGATIVM